MYTGRTVEVPWFLGKVKELSPKTLLDVGFAGGWYGNEILDLGVKYIGLDNDANRISGIALKVGSQQKQEWRQFLARINYIQDDIVNPHKTLFSRKFDVVASISAIEHIVPAGYACTYHGLDSDIKAIENMKKLSDILLLTFPVGKTKCFFDPRVNKNTILKNLPNFHKGTLDVLFYDEERVNRIIGDWQVKEKLFYVEKETWEQCLNESEIYAIDHQTADPKTICLLHIEKVRNKK